MRENALTISFNGRGCFFVPGFWICIIVYGLALTLYVSFQNLEQEIDRCVSPHPMVLFLVCATFTIIYGMD